jgi:hypothetical protein
MMMSRKLGADMTLLLSLRFLIIKTRCEKAVGRFYRFFFVTCVFFNFLGGLITRFSAIRVFGDLYQSYLLRRFLHLVTAQSQ